MKGSLMTQRLPKIAAGLLLISQLLVNASQPAWAQHLHLDTQSEQLAQQLTQLAQTLPPDPFQRSLELSLATLEGSLRSQVLKQLLLNLREENPSATGYWLIHHLSHTAAPHTAPHPERAAYAHDPVGLAAVAQGTANSWSWQHWRQQMVSQGNSGRWDALNELVLLADSAKPADKAALLGAAAGVEQLDADLLKHPLLRKTLIEHPTLKPLTLSAVRVSGDVGLLEAAMSNWPVADQTSVTLTLDRWLGVDHAVVTWQRLAITQSPGASSARDALGRMLRSGQLADAKSRQVRALLEASQ